MANTLSTAAHSELLIRKSRFIGCVQPVEDRNAALDVVQGLRAMHPDAAHVCWALMAGGQSAAVDDGEPTGTAGRPMLEVLRHHDLDGVLATVVRYFGGVKLGAGGLLRAYTDCIAQAMMLAEKQELQRWVSLRCTLPYALEGRLRRELDAAGARIDGIAHGQEVEVAFTLTEAGRATLIRIVDDAGKGQVRWLGSVD